MSDASSTSKDTEKPRLIVIDVLRGVAALGVVFYHFFGFYRHVPGHPSAFAKTVLSVSHYGALGVEIFFVISGFVIALVRPRVDFNLAIGMRFLSRRLLRLIPPYIFSIFACLLVYLMSRYLGRSQMESQSVSQYLAHFGFLQYILGYAPLQEVYWTICLEAQFYLFFLLLLLLNRVLNARGRPAVTAIIHLLPYFASLALFAFGYRNKAFFPQFWYAFAIGSILCLSREKSLPTWTFPLCWGLLAAVLGYRRWDSVIVVLLTSGILYVVLRTGLNGGKTRVARVLASVGLISYSLYLIHSLIGMLIFNRLKGIVGGNDGAVAACIVLATVTSLAASVFMYHFVEKPAIRWSHHLRVRPPGEDVRPKTAAPSASGLLAQSVPQPEPKTTPAVQDSGC